MKGIRVMRVQTGIGMHKTLHNPKVEFHGPKFSVYHGQWREGLRHGYGQRYDESGVYSGFWEQERIRGTGHMDYAAGTAFKGIFDVQRTHTDPKDGYITPLHLHASDPAGSPWTC